MPGYRDVSLCFWCVFFPQELQFRVLDDLDVSRKRRPPLKYILSRTMGFWGSGSFFFLSSVHGLDSICTRFVHGLSTVCPRSPGTLGFQSPASFFFRELRTRSGLDLYTVRPRFVFTCTLGFHIFSVFTNTMCLRPLASCGFWIEYLELC